MMAWREKYRPDTISGLVGCDEFKSAALEWTVESCPPNLMIVGPPGVGKSTAALALAREMLGDFYDSSNLVITNASDERGIGYIRDELKHIVKHKGLMVKRRFIIMDEADNLTSDAQKALRQIMESSWKTCIFVLIGNDISGFHKAIKDRCAVFQFREMGPNEVEEVCLRVHEGEGLPEEWKEHYRNLAHTEGGSARSVVDLLQSLSKKPGSLLERIRGSGEDMSKAALNLAAGNFPAMSAHISKELQTGANRFYILKGLRFRAKGLLDDGDEWFAFMKTYGDFVMMATQWPDDDAAFFEYFVASLAMQKKKMNSLEGNK